MIGRRKTSVARVRVSKLVKGVMVNNRPLEEYLPTSDLVQTVLRHFKEHESFAELGATVVVKGGGSVAQAEAMRHGITRALVEFLPEHRKHLKDLGFLTRDSRKKERKKFGLRKARRAPQWSKR